MVPSSLSGEESLAWGTDICFTRICNDLIFTWWKCVEVQEMNESRRRQALSIQANLHFKQRWRKWNEGTLAIKCRLMMTCCLRILYDTYSHFIGRALDTESNNNILPYHMRKITKEVRHLCSTIQIRLSTIFPDLPIYCSVCSMCEYEREESGTPSSIVAHGGAYLLHFYLPIILLCWSLQPAHLHKYR